MASVVESVTAIPEPATPAEPSITHDFDSFIATYFLRIVVPVR